MSIKGFLVSLAAGAGLTAGLIAQAQTPAPPNTYNHYGDDQTDTTMCWSGQTKPSWAPANEPQCSSYGMGVAQILPGTPGGCKTSVPATGGSVSFTVTVTDQQTTVNCTGPASPVSVNPQPPNGTGYCPAGSYNKSYSNTSDFFGRVTTATGDGTFNLNSSPPGSSIAVVWNGTNPTTNSNQYGTASITLSCSPPGSGTPQRAQASAYCPTDNSGVWQLGAFGVCR